VDRGVVATRSRLRWIVALALDAFLLLGACSATAATETTTRTPQTPATTSSTTGSPTTNTSTPAPVDSRVPLVACPTSLGIPTQATVALPSFLSLRVPTSLAGRVAVYADTQDIMRLVAPRGWDCQATYGADGQGGIEVFAATEHTSSGAPFAQLAEAVAGHETSACVRCELDQACPLFTSAAQQLQSQYQQSCSPAPAGQQATQLDTTVIAFEDPPGVAGVGKPSGGANTANGVMTYVPYSHNGSWIETCTLPPDDHALCTASLDYFVTRDGSQ
jgi:hypothetical protein